LSLGSKKLGAPSNPFTTTKVTIKLPALKSTPLLRKRFKLRSPFTKA
jgi:hypothetical protein